MKPAIAMAWALTIALHGCGGGNGGGSGDDSGGATPSTATATSDGTNVVFKAADGSTLLDIPLVNQRTVASTPNGDLTTDTRETALISSDGSHAGIYSVKISSYPTDTEGSVTATFRHYDSTGELWHVVAPAGAAFYQSSSSSQPCMTPDGSRVVLVSTGLGNSNPVISVYDQGGHILYRSPDAAFDGLYQARLSPSGRFVALMGAISGVTPDLLRVFDVDAKVSYDFPFDLVVNGKPSIGLTGDGRFQISYSNRSTVLPPR